MEEFLGDRPLGRGHDSGDVLEPDWHVQHWPLWRNHHGDDMRGVQVQRLVQRLDYDHGRMLVVPRQECVQGLRLLLEVVQCVHVRVDDVHRLQCVRLHDRGHVLRGLVQLLHDLVELLQGLHGGPLRSRLLLARVAASPGASPLRTALKARARTASELFEAEPCF